MIKLFRRFYYAFRISKEVNTMATVYTTLIVMGLKFYNEVPGVLKEAVAAELRALDLEKLIVE